MPFVHRNGASIYWRADGKPDLPPLLLGNSLGTDQSLWDCIMPQLMRSFRVVRMDMRGHGASALTDKAADTDWSIELLAQDVLAVADAAGIESFYYAGVSIGGMLGLWLAAHASERVKGLLASNTAAKLPEGVWPARIAAVRAGGMAAVVEATLSRWFTAVYSARADAWKATVHQNFLLTNPVVYAGCGVALNDMDLRSDLGGIKMPTTVLAGTFDLSTPPELARSIANAIPGAKYVELPVAHIPHLERPEQFVAEVCGLLGRASRPHAGALQLARR